MIETLDWLSLSPADPELRAEMLVDFAVIHNIRLEINQAERERELKANKRKGKRKEIGG